MLTPPPRKKQKQKSILTFVKKSNYGIVFALIFLKLNLNELVLTFLYSNIKQYLQLLINNYYFSIKKNMKTFFRLC